MKHFILSLFISLASLLGVGVGVASGANPVSTSAADLVAPADDAVTVRNFYVKTNAPAWALLWANASLEVDFAPHWSGALPLYGSSFNYFSPRVKYRIVACQPEVRWWPRGENLGFFVGAHVGFAFYNTTLGGDYRYQDRNGKTPAWGGGLSIGYRVPLTHNHRWGMEITIGCGVYDFKYDIFRNEPNGLYIGTRHDTKWGIDNAALSFYYRFDAGRMKGGGK